MSFFRKSNLGSPEKVNPLYLVIAFFVMPFIEAARWCTDKAYSGWKGAIVAFFGLGFSFGGAIGAGHYVSSNFGFGTFWSSLAGVAAWIAVMFYIWPLLWRFAVKPAWDLCDAVYDRVRKYTEKYSKPFFGFFVNVASTICVGSKGAWARLQSTEGEGTWFASLLGIVGYVSSFAGTAYLGWLTYGWVAAALTIPVVGFAAAVFAGCLTFGVTFGLLSQFLSYGKMSFIGIVVSVAAVYGAAPYLVAWTGLTGALAYGVQAAAFVVTLGYVFPFLNEVLTNGFWAKVWKFVKPLPEKTYDDRDEKYSEFFHHVVNFLVTAGTTGGAWYIAATAGLPIWGIAPIALVAAALTYIIGFKVINHGGGNFIVGALTSLAVGYKVGALYVASGFVYGIWGAIVAGVLGTIVNGVVLFPVAYLLLRGLLMFFGASALADPLTSLYKSANEQFKKGLKEIRHAYDNCYRDKTKYKDLILNLVNIVITYAAFAGTVALIAGVHAGPILGWTAVVLATGLSYILIGKLLKASGYGLEFVGACAALWAGITVGQLVYGIDATGLMKFAGVVAGISTWFAAFFIALPVAYVVARFVTSWAFTGWLEPITTWLHDSAWGLFKGFWKGFVVTYNWLWDLSAPLRAGLAKAWAGVAEQYRRILRVIRGGR
jgi:hypothetical protein